MTPAETLLAAADRVRDRTGTRDQQIDELAREMYAAWQPNNPYSFVEQSDDVRTEYLHAAEVIVDRRAAEGRWIAALSPATAGPLERLFREYARCAIELGYVVENSPEGTAMLELARAILGSAVDTP